ncbi:hypothetical protein E1193_16430 [Micromonospora sp. KC606]|uniref:hypothetical protein n=1 Tax=Micromonospora sp. KC606 TaxID=2530379 RepID=UPI0010475BA2|nr:hypothetical protein [Micromonospora sp. KC606]TDC80870.1 hypothetical protein E1193_16430 [Micromonospora sp. KC606]
MKTISPRLGRLVAACAIAVVTLVAGNAAPAAAATSRNHQIYGVTGSYLGWGAWESYPVGEHRNGKMWVHDSYCDGDNGIVAALYKWTGERWSGIVNVVSVRGCGKTNTISVKPYWEGGPEEGQGLWFRVCKLLPDGTWKGCEESFPVN